MKLLKIVVNEWNNESRDQRELSVCQEMGMDVMVMAKGQPGDSFRQNDVDGFKVFRFSTRPLGSARWLDRINRFVSLFTWSYKARKFQADIISGHDICGLLIGYLSNLGNPHKAKLVYDSHEFEIGRAAKRTRFQIWCITHLERFLIKRCSFSVMVNDSIADEVQNIHHLEKRPVVVRSIPNYWKLDPQESARIRASLLKKLSVSEGVFLVMYHGALAPSRGIENLLQVTAKVPGIAAVILGNALDADYLASLHTLCNELGIKERVLFHPAVPLQELRHYVSAVDISAFIGQGNQYRSYYLSLPNKFFESIQSMTPMVVSNFPEMVRLLKRYEIGLVVDSENVDQVAAAILKLRTDKDFYATCKKNLERAKQELCWENERLVLLKAYSSIV